MTGQLTPKNQGNLFKAPIESFINHNEVYCQLAWAIDWESLENNLLSCYSSSKGRPSVPIRIMIALLIIKHIENISDEKLINDWRLNPYYQYFSGMTSFQHENPCNPSLLSQFRKRIGEAGAELILRESVSCCQKELPDTPAELETEVLVDTTVQPKNITPPTDTKLKLKVIAYLRLIAQKEGIKLRQSYTKTVKNLVRQANSRSKKNTDERAVARKELQKIGLIMLKEVQRKLGSERLEYYEQVLNLYERALNQEKNTKNKIYSLHEPEVYCVGKGKFPAKYEFGCKVSIITGLEHGIIMGALSFTDNPHDTKTIGPALEQFEKLHGYLPKCVIADRGYKSTQINGVEIRTPSKPTQAMSAAQKQRQRKRFRKRAGIEPIIGHLKSDHRLGRNFLKGTHGDAVNVLLAAAGFNFKKWARLAFLFAFGSVCSALGNLLGSPHARINPPIIPANRIWLLAA